MPRILIVDDNDDNRDVLKRRLERRGFDIVTATGGKDGIEHAQADSPDVILMDMNMPELDGWEATKQIREQGITVPVIALTAHAMTGDRERAIEAGCTEYHTKPVEMDKLLSLIEHLLSVS
ncbi:response regulator [Novipirellula rosea]|uniref:Response regulator n=1 Tax=Novipirellula rosea TaxID=1031540 RepID=A0ABP8MRV1_9BACT|tara:strand:+ start:4400 stop:4762 length:363 start_codon:yes stop_codon:yes gene_type:complete